MTRVTVGLPVFNGGKHLEETLQGLRAQDYPDFEIVVSDNGSTDETPAILERARAADPRIRVIRRPATVPGCDNFNGLVGEASGAYFAWSAADDLHHPTFLSKLVAVLDRDPATVLAFPQSQFFGRASDEDRAPGYAKRPFGREPTGLGRAVAMLRRAHRYTLIYGLARTDALRKTRLFDPSMGWISDVGLAISLAALGRLQLVPEVLFFARRYERDAGDRTAAVDKGYRGRGFHEGVVDLVESLPMTPVEKRVLARELRLWCRKSQKPRPLWLKPKPIRWAHLRVNRTAVDVLRWYHGV